MVADTIPRSQGYVSVESRRYNEWQNLAFEATTNREDVSPETHEGPLVDQRSYPTPRKILRCQEVKIEEESNDCSVDKLLLDRSGIVEDMMHNVDENDGDNRAIIMNHDR